MNFIQITGIICFQSLIYFIGSYVLLNEKKWNKLNGIFFAFAGIAGFIFFNVNLHNVVYISLIAAVIHFSMIEGSLKNKFLCTFKSVFIITCLEEMIESGMLLIATIYDFSTSSFTLYLTANLFLLVILVLIVIIKVLKVKLPIKLKNSIHIISICLLTIDLLMVIGSLRFAEKYVENNKFTIISEILIIISYLGIAILGIFVIYVKKSNENYKILLETESLLRESEKCNFELMLAKEEATKGFRHDVGNHVLCLQSLLKSNQIDEAINYLDQFSTVIHQIQKKQYSTGNDIIDAILNYHINMLDKNVEISVAGVCSNDLHINNVQLCSIISNPIQNAVIELNNQKFVHRFLHVKIKNSQDVFEIKISNSIFSKPLMGKNGLPVTNKRDKLNHGYGLKNVNKLVQQLNGIFNIEIIEGEFQIKIILPI